MKNAQPIIVVIAVIVIAIFSVIFFSDTTRRGDTKEGAGGEIVSSESVEKSLWESITNEESPVVVTATPEVFGNDENIWKIRVLFETHTGSLDDDPMEVIRLLDDSGNMYVPTAWDGASAGGHHREGIIIFDAPDNQPKSVTLEINKVGGITKREFTWKLVQ